MSPPRANLEGAVVAFDLDGTLVDTAPDLVSALNVVLGECGLAPLPLATARVMVGRGARALIEQGFSAAGKPLNPDRAALLVDRFIEVYRGRIADQSRPFDGVEQALNALAASGAALCVCTNKPTALSIALLDAVNLTARFAAIVGPDRAPASKPDARHLLTAIEAAGGRAQRALMVGDSAVDVGAARAAGVPIVLVPFGYTEIEAAALGGDHVIAAYEELPALAAKLLSEDQS